MGRHGPFVGCSSYPECKYTRRLSHNGDDDGAEEMAAGPKLLGLDPATKLEISLRKGPYGPYVQLGEETVEGKKKIKPKRTSIPRGFVVADIDLATAIKLIGLPRDIGQHPEDQVMMQAGIGRFGPFVKHGGTYVSLPDAQEVLSVGVNRAVALLAEKGTRRGGQTATPIRELGNHPEDDKPVNMYKGRYGPYVKHGRTNASIPKGREPDTVTLAEAIDLLNARQQRKKPAPKKAAATTKKKAAATTKKKKPAAKRKAPATKRKATADAS